MNYLREPPSYELYSMVQTEPLWMWLVFSTLILFFLWMDLAWFNRRPHAISIRESLLWTAFWTGVAFGFSVFLYIYYGFTKLGENKALEFLTGFIVEKSLSVDNLFVILLIFQYFKVKAHYQHRVLFWGIFGALVMRLLLILVGVKLIATFHILVYVFGAFLIATAIRLGTGAEHEVHPERNMFVRIFRRFFPVSSTYHEHHFFLRQNGQLIATPLFIVLLVIEATDLVFAVDSIPAILAISKDPFIVFTSNAFAVLGLRSLYFALSGVMQLFVFLRYGLAAILAFVGVKMLTSDFIHISTGFSLCVIVGILAITIASSLIRSRHSTEIKVPSIPVDETFPE